jgi:hypothetical protein
MYFYITPLKMTFRLILHELCSFFPFSGGQFWPALDLDPDSRSADPIKSGSETLITFPPGL